MEFKLCYKSYEIKDTFKADLDFKRATGRSIWAVLQGIHDIGVENAGTSVRKMLRLIAEYIDKIDGSQLLYILAKQCNSMLQLGEIQDGVQRVGMLPVDSDDEGAQPYTYVLYKLANELINQQNAECPKPPKDSCD